MKTRPVLPLRDRAAGWGARPPQVVSPVTAAEQVAVTIGLVPVLGAYLGEPGLTGALAVGAVTDVVASGAAIAGTVKI